MSLFNNMNFGPGNQGQGFDNGNIPPKKPNSEKLKKQLKNARRTVLVVCVCFIVCILGYSSYYTVKDSEYAVVTTFGSPSTVSASGMHFKIPFIQQVHKVTKNIRGAAIGYDEKSNESIESESLMITYDYNFINADFYIEYQVTDPIKALYASSDPTVILENLAQSYIRDTIGLYNVDDVLTTGKSEIQSAIKEKLINRLDSEDIGIQVVNVTIQDASPPTDEVRNAFKAVETAKQGKETAVNNANKYKNEKIPAAAASVDQILKEAEATKQARINEANGQVARFESLYAEYIKYPTVTKRRMFYETMEDVLPDLKVYIVDGDGTQTMLPLDSFTSPSTTPETQTANPAESEVSTNGQ